MSAALVASFLLASAVRAKVLPRQGSLSTLDVPIPTQATPFTTTISGCDLDGSTVAPFVVEGVTTGTFFPGTITIFLPPQADPTSTTIIDDATNATEVVIAAPLPGTCADFPFPPAPSPTGTTSSAPSSTPDACPEKGCSGQVVRGAQLIIDALNKVTLLSQNLQTPAKLVGTGVSKRDDGQTTIAQGPIQDVARGLTNIATTLTAASPRFLFLPPLPAGCDSDTVVIALIKFVQVHQALLNILIGQGGLLEKGPVKRGAYEEGAVQLHERGEDAFVGAIVATALRAVEKIVDTVAFTLISLIPTRSECAKQQKAALDASLQESITTYEG